MKVKNLIPHCWMGLLAFNTLAAASVTDSEPTTGDREREMMVQQQIQSIEISLVHSLLLTTNIAINQAGALLEFLRERNAIDESAQLSEAIDQTNRIKMAYEESYESVLAGNLPFNFHRLLIARQEELLNLMNKFWTDFHPESLVPNDDDLENGTPSPEEF